MKNVIILSFCCLFLMSYKSISYVKEMNRITTLWTQEMEKKHELITTGRGGGMLSHIELISIHFHSNKSTTLEEAREIMIDISQNLLDRINAEIIIRPYLEHYPFTSRGLILGITFSRNEDVSDEKKYIKTMLNGNNSISYFVFDEQSCINSRIIHDEPYVQALKIIHDEKQQK